LKKKEILTPDHDLWDEFYRGLCGQGGCDFRLDPAKGYGWKCNHGNSKQRTRAVLKTMPTIDVEGTLAYFDARGLSCDCKILFNATGSELDDELH